MRKILFQGQRTDNKEWIEGCYIESVAKNSPFAYITPSYPSEPIRVYSKTVGEYTGINDKNGKKIFEGDIVKTKTGRLCEVYWFTSPNMSGWDLRPVECNNPAPPEYDLFLSQNLEVVGNIYTDSELLRKEDKMIHKLYNNDGTVDYHFDKKALDEVLNPFCKKRENNDIDGQILYVSSRKDG